MKYYLLLLSALVSNLLLSQTSYTVLDYNNVSARVNTHGRWFNDLVASSGYIVPKNEGVSSIFSTSFIMGGMDDNNNLKLAGTIYGNGQDYFVGPISDNSGSVDFNMHYDRLWKVSNAEILQHQASYSEPDYVIPESIASWPGNGNTANGESYFLAPFVDLNADGVYNPNEGDYPQIKGDQAVYFIMNDYNGLHTETGGARIGVEIHAMTYSFSAATDSPVNDCVFINLQVRKKVGGNLSNFYLGIYNDFDLGAYNDDYIGTDSIRNMVYVYNGQFEDHPVTGSAGYGNHIPSQGCMFFNQPMAKSVYWNLSGFGHPNSQEPTTAEHFYNYLRGLWNTGNQITRPLWDANGIPVSYVYNGSPETNTGWTEASDNNSPGDRRIFMSCGPYNLTNGETFCVDIAFPFARGTVDANPALAVGELRQNANFIQEFYDSFSYQCLTQSVNVKETMEAGLSVYPNPSNGRFFFNSDKEINYVEVYDLPGKLVFTSSRLSQNTKLTNVDLTGRVNGVYLFKAHHKDGSIQQGKIILE